MMESKTNQSAVLSTLALAIMAGGGLLLGWTINSLSCSIEALATFALLLVSVFLYVAGATWMGRIITQTGKYWKYGGYHNGIVFALLVIGVGILWLCLNGGMLPYVWKSFFISWPMLLFVIGSIELCKIHYIPGIILISLGTFFLFPRISDILPGVLFNGPFFSVYWPVFIIIGGLLIFFSILLKPQQFLRIHHHRHQKGCWDDNHSTTQEENRDGKINYKCVFSGTEQVILDPVFKGGYIETVFGGIELDLRRTSLPEGETFLHVNAAFGGVDIQAPEEWHIETRSESVFGGVSDDRIKVREIDYTKKLIIVANAVFGGVTIR
jgi:predicted membrane protein